jgi:hypothetical protein
MFDVPSNRGLAKKEQWFGLNFATLRYQLLSMLRVNRKHDSLRESFVNMEVIAKFIWTSK